MVPGKREGFSQGWVGMGHDLLNKEIIMVLNWSNNFPCLCCLVENTGTRKQDFLKVQDLLGAIVQQYNQVHAIIASVQTRCTTSVLFFF